MENKIFGYVRVSTAEQNEGRQLEALKQYKILDRDIYIDKVSGKDFNRPEYQRMKSNLRKGDTVVIQNIDRLGRNYNQIKEEWQSISKDLGCHFIIIEMSLLNTASPNAGGLTGKLIADVVLEILAFVAETERENIKKRQSQGISLALNNGVKFGRPKVEKPSEWDTVYTKWIAKEITAVEAMRQLNLKPNTFYRFVTEINASTKIN